MKIAVLDLRPTQLAIGLHEVDLKIERLLSLKRDQRDEFVRSHKVPAVLGPRGRVYIVDHHHLARACWEAGEAEMSVTVVEDFSKLAYPEFWRRLAARQWLHLFDQFGRGPHQPCDLPRSVRGLADDPFRSLAWRAREHGAFQKSDAPFAEFAWAEFFRRRVKSHPVFDGREPALAEAMALAKSRAARSLPGFVG